MKVLNLAFLTTVVLANPGNLPWHPPTYGDVRSPCPMLNALANHDIIPHNGKNITQDIILKAFPSILNFDIGFSENFFKLALTTVKEANAMKFDLDDLNRHDFIEIDASLSREDAYFGDNHSFNRTIWAQSRSYWPNAIIDIPSGAAAVAARVRTSWATNPEFSLNGTRLPMSAGSVGIFTTVLGDHTSGTVKKSFIRELFEYERLPVAQGWKKSAEVIQGEHIGELGARIFAATGLDSNGTKVMSSTRRFEHGGLSLRG